MPTKEKPRTPRQAEAHARYMLYYMQNRADKLRDNGLCVICGKHSPREERQTCWGCKGK